MPSTDKNPLFVPGFHETDTPGLKYTRLGNTDMIVSQIGLGCGPLGGIYGELDEEEGITTVVEAVKAGINYIDTAPYYGVGKSETLLGKALEQIPRGAYHVATKIGRYDVLGFDFSAERTVRSVHESLEKLKCGHIDLIQVHDLEFADDPSIIWRETLPALEKLRKEGLVRYIGVNGYPLSSLWNVLENNEESKVDTILSYARWNFFDKTLDDYMDKLKAKGVGVIYAAIMAMGLLTKTGVARDWHPAPQDLKDFCKKIAEYCQSKDVDFGRLAVAYAASHPDLAVHLVGMQNRRILRENLDVFVNGLKENEQKLLVEVEQKFKEKFPEQRVNWEEVTDVMKEQMYGKK